MANNKVTYFGQTLIDLTDATVTPDSLLAGVTAYGASGTRVTGTLSLDSYEFITVADIDTICSSTISVVSMNGEVKF